MNKIAEMMYSKNEEVHRMNASQKVIELEKKLKVSLTDEQLKMFLAFQDLESDSCHEQIKKAYDHGFKDAISLIRSLNEI